MFQLCMSCCRWQCCWWQFCSATWLWLLRGGECWHCLCCLCVALVCQLLLAVYLCWLSAAFARQQLFSVSVLVVWHLRAGNCWHSTGIAAAYLGCICLLDRVLCMNDSFRRG